MANSIVLERSFKTASGNKATTLNRRRVYILPTRNGWLFALMLIVIFLGAINYNNSLAYVLSFLLGSVTLVGLFYTYRNLAGLVLTPAQPEAVYAGETASFPLFIDNRELHARFAIELGLKPETSRWYQAVLLEDGSQLIDIEANSNVRYHLTKHAQQRGRLSYGRLQVTSSFPLGLFRAWSNIDIAEQCIVYPAPKGKLPLPDESDYEQSEHQGQQAGNDDFAGFKPYRPGDSSRHLDWKAYAREKGLHRKQFSGYGGNRLMLRWQQLAHLQSTEAILSQLCQWVRLAEAGQNVYALELPDQFIPLDQGAAQQQRCLEALACYGLDK